MPKDKKETIIELELGKKSEKSDELQLEIHKEEKENKPPITLKKFSLIFLAILVGSVGFSLGLAAIFVSAGSIYNFSELVSYFLLIFGSFAIIGGGMIGFWGGQRKIPIRLVSPSDASVIGRGFLVCGYIIEDCLYKEIELSIYNKNKQVIHEENLKIIDGLFYTGIEDNLANKAKSTQLTVEVWMVSMKSKQRKFAVRSVKLEEMNVATDGIKIGGVNFFPSVHRDFKDRAKAIYNPKRKEKWVIENIQIDYESSSNILFPAKNADRYVPFSFERVAKMRQNALYFDIRRTRRLLYSAIFFLMGLIYFIYPIILGVISLNA